jgi:hypothetical protein
MKSLKLRVAVAVVLCLTLSVAAVAQEDPGKAIIGGKFPSAGVDIINHLLTIALYSVQGNGEPGELLETLKFKGRMLVERGDPYVNKDGYSQIPFVVKSWEAFAWSNKLNSLVTYSTSGVDQKGSIITAQKKGSNFPAKFLFHVIFNVNAFGQNLTEEPHCGTPEGDGFMEVPPSGNRLTSPSITKFDVTRIQADHPTLGKVMFVPLLCEDEGGTTLVTYTAEQKKTLNLPSEGSPAVDLPHMQMR